jgi:hypothetical protein
MRALLYAGEMPHDRQHVDTVVQAFREAGDEARLVVATAPPRPGDIEAATWFGRHLRGVLWRRARWAPNRYQHERAAWFDEHGERVGPASVSDGFPCPPFRTHLPWRPDVVVVVSPHQGHAKHHLVPWANAAGIPVLSIDHGSPTVLWPWLTYRGSMMGCTANAVWSTVCADINARAGAPAERQVITGSPSIDGLQRTEGIDIHAALDLPVGAKIVLLLGTHRPSVKAPTDAAFAAVMDMLDGRNDVVVVHKPHPVEVRMGTTFDGGPRVRRVEDQSLYLPLVQSASAIVSPATSVIVPAMAAQRPFINTLVPGCGAVDEEELGQLLQELEGVAFGVQDLGKILDDGLLPDPAACARVFERFGHRSDGRNGARVASLARWLAAGKDPTAWPASDVKPLPSS